MGGRARGRADPRTPGAFYRTVTRRASQQRKTPRRIRLSERRGWSLVVDAGVTGDPVMNSVTGWTYRHRSAAQVRREIV